MVLLSPHRGFSPHSVAACVLLYPLDHLLCFTSGNYIVICIPDLFPSIVEHHATLLTTLINLYSKLAVSRLGYSCGVFSLSWFEKHSNAISVSHQLSTHILPAADRHRPTPRHWLAARRPTSRRSEAICSSGKLLIGTARTPFAQHAKRSSNGGLTCVAWRREDAGG